MISAIIMASGSSRRMGKNKLKLKYKEKFIFEYVIDLVSSYPFDEKIIVTNDLDIIKYAEDNKITSYTNEEAIIGKSESIKIGIRNSKQKNACMFFVCDQPLLTKETVDKIIEKFNADKSLITFPIYLENRGSPMIFPPEYREKLLKLEKDQGGVILIDQSNSQSLIINSSIENLDIDIEEDYKRILELWKKR